MINFPNECYHGNLNNFIHNKYYWFKQSGYSKEIGKKFADEITSILEYLNFSGEITSHKQVEYTKLIVSIFEK